MMEKRLSALRVGSMMLLVVWWMVISPATGCPSDGGRGCKTCIVNQMKFGCPTCVPILRCMARCLWGGSSRPNCVKKCDCGGGNPKLSDCKRCMSHCKCSCMAYQIQMHYVSIIPTNLLFPCNILILHHFNQLHFLPRSFAWFMLRIN